MAAVVSATRRSQRLVVLLHEHDVVPKRYVLWAVKDVWERDGIEVRVVRGVDRLFDADVALCHVNLTEVPEAYRRYLARYPRVVNDGTWDISKTRVSANLVGPDTAYDGPVIVKTDRNYGGMPERDFLASALARRAPLAWVRAGWRHLRRGIAPAGAPPAPLDARRWRTVERLDPRAYPIYASLRDVPPGVFENPALVVERFLPERDGARYVLRLCAFLGDRHVNVRTTAAQPIVKASAASEEVPVHPDVLAFRARLGFDFGKLDYVVRDGAAVVFDMNRTPTFGATATREFQARVGAYLAPGLAAARESASSRVGARVPKSPLN